MTEGISEEVDLIIKCALQTFDDTPIRCSLNWTVRRLKEELSTVCSSKPEASRQRLIYAGHCLQDDRTLRSVFENRINEEVRVLHLVCPPKDVTDFGIRKRKTQKTGFVYLTVNGASPTTLDNANGVLPNSATRESSPPSLVGSSWATFSQSMSPQFPNTTPTNAQVQSIYNAYLYSYYNYMQQVMMSMNVNMQTPLPAPQMYVPNSNNVASQIPNIEQQHQPQFEHQVAPEVRNAAPGGIAQNAIIEDIEVPQRDFLDVFYKAIRMCFLFMLVYVYSSAERLIGVFMFIFVAWFIQARRDRNGRERDEREVAQAVNDVRQQPQTESRENENRAAPAEETATPNAEENVFREPSAWSLFWSTCYAFVSGFISSLVPENPPPVNVN